MEAVAEETRTRQGGQVKSAEEWVKDFWKREFNGTTVTVNDCFVKLFREIQKDAGLHYFKAGERFAASVSSAFSTKPDRWLHPDIPWSAMTEGVQIAAHSTAQVIADEILADAATRTSLPEEKG